jgi:membrane protein
VQGESPESPEARAAHPHETLQVRALEIVRRVIVGVYSDGFIHAGNIAYLTLVALFPFFIVVTALAQLIGRSDAGADAVASFLHVLPRSIADLLRPVIGSVLAARTGPLLWLGALVGLWTVGSFIETIRDILRRAYGTQFSRPFWEYRLWSVLIIVVAVLLSMLAFAVQVALTAAKGVIERFFPVAREVIGWVGLSRLVPGVILFGALYILFLALTPSKYRYGNNPKWPGALFTAGWWLSATAVLPVVLARISYNLTYGSLAGVIVALFFFWLVGLGLVIGAHLNAALAESPAPGLEGDAQDA